MKVSPYRSRTSGAAKQAILRSAKIIEIRVSTWLFNLVPPFQNRERTAEIFGRTETIED
jgi:hypothetical protein